MSTLFDGAANNTNGTTKYRWSAEQPILVADLGDEVLGGSPHLIQADTSAKSATSESWEQKYEAGQKLLHDTYYSKDRLDHSKFAKVSKKFLGHVQSEDDYIKAMKSTAASLNDPWTEFTTDREIKEQRQNFAQGHRFAGIWVKSQGKDVVIENLLYGFPAYNSTLRIGDKLLSVNGHSLKGLTADQVDTLLGGQDGTQLHLEFQPPKGKIETMDLPLVEPQNNASSAELIDDPHSGKKVLHLKLLAFSRDSCDQLESAIKALPADQLKQASGIVLDLRGNEGGLLRPMNRAADMFLAGGDLFQFITRQSKDMIQVHAFDESEYTLDAPTRAALHSLPMVVMINGTTRSAAETLTAGLRDRSRLKAVVGTKSYGKSVAFEDEACRTAICA